MEYIEYPRHLHKAGGEHVVVHNDAEKAAALKAGWSLMPVLEPVEAALVDEELAPSEDIDASAGESEPKKKGRKSKAD